MLLLQHFTQGIAPMPETPERIWLHLLQGRSGNKRAVCSPCTVKANQGPTTVLGRWQLVREQFAAQHPGDAGGCRAEGRNSPGRLQHPLIRQRSSRDNVVRPLNVSCNFRLRKKFLPNTLCSCQHSAPQRSAWKTAAGVK